jgi:hypothetical protein
MIHGVARRVPIAVFGVEIDQVHGGDAGINEWDVIVFDGGWRVQEIFRVAKVAGSGELNHGVEFCSRWMTRFESPIISTRIIAWMRPSSPAAESF